MSPSGDFLGRRALPDVPEISPRQRSAVSLRDYQLEALAEVEARYLAGIHRQLVALPTGTGKTILFSEVVRRRGGRSIILAHRDELIESAVEKLGAIAPDIATGIVKAQRDETDAACVLASVQTVARPSRLARLVGPFSTVVVDEAHHAAAKTYRSIIDHLVSRDTLLLGVTATPDRGDGAGLDAIFQEIVYKRALPEMIGLGYLSDLRAIQITTGADFSALHVTRGDFSDTEAAEALLEGKAPELVARAYAEHAKDRRSLLFTPTVEVAYAMADALRSVGVAAEALDGTTPIEERRAILHRLRTGETTAVANCAVLTEGFDESLIDCVVIAKPTRSRAAYVQMIGRGTRRHPGKDDCLVLDVTGAIMRHDLVTLAGLAGLEPSLIARRPVVQALAEVRPRQAQAGTWAAELVSQEVDLFRRRPMAWVASGGRYVLSLGNGYLALEAHRDTWSVVRHPRGGSPEIVASGLSLQWAMGVGEDRARQLGAIVLIDRNAPWRSRPASHKQLDCLARWRIPIDALSITAGEASDLIAARMARRSA